MWFRLIFRSKFDDVRLCRMKKWFNSIFDLDLWSFIAKPLFWWIQSDIVDRKCVLAHYQVLLYSISCAVPPAKWQYTLQIMDTDTQTHWPQLYIIFFLGFVSLKRISCLKYFFYLKFYTILLHALMWAHRFRSDNEHRSKR